MNTLQWVGLAMLGFVGVVVLTDLLDWARSRIGRRSVAA